MNSQDQEKRRRRDRGDDGISWDKTNKVYVGTISLGYKADATRDRRTVRAKTKTKAEVKDKLDVLREEIKAGSAPRPPTPSSSVSGTGSTPSSSTTTRWTP